MSRQNKITQSMITECYEAYRNNNKKYVPQGMNSSSAGMTMLWLDSLIVTGKSDHRDGSCLQYELILGFIKNDYGVERLKIAKSILLEHCEWSLEKHNKPMISHRRILEKF